MTGAAGRSIKTMSKRRRFGVAVLAGLAVSTCMAAARAADSYPSKPIRLIVPFAAGGPVDAAARIIGQKLPDFLGQPLVVDNRAGGDTIIGSEIVAHSPHDGYTLLLTSNQLSINPSLRSLPYDTEKDFVPVTMVASTPIFLFVNPSVPANSTKELIALLKAHPDKYFYASSGTGGSQHITGELFKAATGTHITHVPFKGTAPATVALLAGQTQLAFMTPTTTMPYVKTGKLKVLAVTTAKRSKLAPDVPTLEEAGINGFDSSAWIGVLAPGGTSKEVIDRLYGALAKTLRSPDVQQKLLVQGIDTIQMTPDQFATFLQNERTQSAKVIKDAGIHID